MNKTNSCLYVLNQSTEDVPAEAKSAIEVVQTYRKGCDDQENDEWYTLKTSSIK